MSKEMKKVPILTTAEKKWVPEEQYFKIVVLKEPPQGYKYDIVIFDEPATFWNWEHPIYKKLI